MSDCIFCKLAGGEVPADFIYESEDVVALADLHPLSPVHVLIIPKRHFATTLDMSDEAPEIFGAMLVASSAVARIKGIDKSGFRIILNTNADGGQEIFHVHMHVLGGEPIGPMRSGR